MTWLFTIAKRVAVDYFRKSHPEVSLDESTRAPDETVEILIQQRSDFARLSTLLAGLPDRDRELVALKYGAGLTNRMIAQLNGMNLLSARFFTVSRSNYARHGRKNYERRFPFELSRITPT